MPFPPDYLAEVHLQFELLCKVKNGNGLRSKIINLFDKYGNELAECNSQNLRQLENTLFELKVINWIRENLQAINIEYEPSGVLSAGKKVDLRFIDESRGEVILVEIKTIQPTGDILPVPREYFSADTLICDEQYYAWSSKARSHLLDQLRETELKGNNYTGRYVLIHCSDMGFFLENDEAQYAWEYYSTGVLSPDDSYGAMMAYHCENKRIDYEHSIDEFWGLPFGQYSFSFAEGDPALFLKKTGKYRVVKETP